MAATRTATSLRGKAVQGYTWPAVWGQGLGNQACLGRRRGARPNPNPTRDFWEHAVASPSSFSASLFYSYSHKDKAHRARMEDALTLLRKQEGELRDWSDQQIVPGQRIDDEVRRKLEEADIVVFLVSPSFLASEPCMSEWRMACELATGRQTKALIPVILAPCPWMDVDGMSELKALPDDAVPIEASKNADEAWRQVYEGIKAAVNQIRGTFAMKPEFRAEMEASEFVSQERMSLRDVFVFPRLAWY